MGLPRAERVAQAAAKEMDGGGGRGRGEAPRGSGRRRIELEVVGEADGGPAGPPEGTRHVRDGGCFPANMGGR